MTVIAGQSVWRNRDICSKNPGFGRVYDGLHAVMRKISTQRFADGFCKDWVNIHNVVAHQRQFFTQCGSHISVRQCGGGGNVGLAVEQGAKIKAERMRGLAKMIAPDKALAVRTAVPNDQSRGDQLGQMTAQRAFVHAISSV